VRYLVDADGFLIYDAKSKRFGVERVEGLKGLSIVSRPMAPAKRQ
jgi:hypothetical protein